MSELKESEELSKLKSFLNELFQFESQDLDFGIYKILHYKRKEIKNFIDNLLTNEVKTQLNLFNQAEHEKINKEISELEKDELINGFINEKNEEKRNYLLTLSKDKIENYLTLKSQLENVKVNTNIEATIYNHLTIFFSRYYDKGDFISKRRYGKTGKYVIPYNGEETHFYWANNDQYYIKSSEFFKKYTFKLDKTNQIINFRIKEADEETGNVKSENNKYFILAINSVEITKNEINIYFVYRAISEEEKTLKGKKQDDINKYSEKQIKKELGKNIAIEELYTYVNEEKELTKILYELNRYTNKNKYDFFIHKDLKGFLTRELDFYIKNETLNLDDLTSFDSDTHIESIRLNFKEIKTFKNIANIIIDFVSHIEDFQKKLWEKKKFVISTNYVITLDKLFEFTTSFFTNNIIKDIIKNEKQINEWKELFGEELFSDWENIKLKNLTDDDGYKKLPIDTINFDERFKWNLLCEISTKNNIDEILDGLVIHSDNFHGLNLLKECYRESVKCIYIDPPYNTGGDGFIYKDNYKDSSWISMMNNSLTKTYNIFKNEGNIFTSIDNNEFFQLKLLFDKYFGKQNFITDITIQVNKGGRDYLPIAVTHEHLIAYFKSNNGDLNELSKDSSDYKYEDEKGKYTLRELRNRNPKFNSKNRENLFYPIYINTKSIDENKFCLISLKKDKDFTYELKPLNSKRQESCWRWQPSTLLKNISDNTIKSEVIAKQKRDGGWNIYEKYRKLTKKAKSIWDEKDVRTEKGTIDLRELGLAQLIDHPKPVYLIDKILKLTTDYDDIVLDFFAGSGTTAHSVLNLNNENEEYSLKFIMIEQNEYVYTIINPRMKKIAFSFNWKNGIPQDMGGLGIFYKYQKLEQYEDSLENITFTNGNNTEQIQLSYADYIPKYFLNFETQDSNTFLNLDSLKNPFNYTLKVFDNYYYKEKVVDIIETFNFLIGLHTNTYSIEKNKGKDYYFIHGETREGKRMLIIWRDVNKIDYEEDKIFITSQLNNYAYDKLYINHQASIQDYETIENVFKNKMN